jgi:hypothetical protein
MTTENTERATPETDAFWKDMTTGNYQPSWWVAAERMRDHAKRLEQERNEVIKKIQRQAERIRQLEGATNHAGGTPLSIALRERDEAKVDAARIADKLSGLELRSTEELARLEQERNEARDVADELASVAAHCLGWHDHESPDAAIKIAAALKRWKKSK